MIRGGHGGRRSRPQLDDSVQLHPEDNMFDTPTSSSRACYNDLRNAIGHRQDSSYGHGPRAHGRYYGRRTNRNNYPYSRDNNGGSARRLVSPKHKNPHTKYDLKFCIEANQLDDLSPGDIEKLQKLLDRKKSREQQRQQHQGGSNRYVYMDSGRRQIVPYTGPVPDVKKLLTENRFARLADLVVPLEVISGTDFVRHIHVQFENLSRDEMDDLVLARTVAINSAPSLFSILLMAEETCSYFAALDRLDIPVNPYDPYASTLSALKHSTFSKLNVAKLSCMMSDGERAPSASAYDFLKKLASGNGATVKSFSRANESTVAPFPAATKQVPDISDIREFEFDTFKHPFQKVICFLATIEKVVSEIKGHRAPGSIAGAPINLKDRSRYIRDYDKQQILRRYKDGCIIGLVKQGFCEHACNDNACRRRCKYALSVPYNLGMVFCPPTESSSVEDMDAYFDKNRHPSRNGSFDDSRSATSGDGSSCSSAHKVTTPTDGVVVPEFPFSDTAVSNNSTVRFSERRASSSSKHRRRSNKHISPLDRPSTSSGDYQHNYHKKQQGTIPDERRYCHDSGPSFAEPAGASSAPLNTGAASNHCVVQSADGCANTSGRHHSSPRNGGPGFANRSPVATPPEVFSPERHSSEERSSSEQRRKSPLSRSASATSGGSKRRSFVDSPPRRGSDDEDDDSDSSSATQKDRFKKHAGSRSNTPPSSPVKPESALMGPASPVGTVNDSDADGAGKKGMISNVKESIGTTERFESGDKSPTFIETEDESDDEDDQMSITSYDHSDSSSESGSESDGGDGESDMTL
ncbi:mRNA transactivator/RNA splicing transport regulator [Elephant endotheliotropic herpesvirus 6]|nr:mRNA transactivator/RNA splicing transport regulator [Elephant endotheliotropic herpesvirus 6]